jgi:hypothetical protein
MSEPKKVKSFLCGEDLPQERLVEIVNEIQRLLWFTVDLDADDPWVPDPDKELDSETLEHVSGVLGDAGMQPEWDDTEEEKET